MKKLYDLQDRKMRVAGFMSGSGSNLKKIIERSEAPYEVVVIFSDNPESNAKNIGNQYGIPVITRDMTEFYKEKNKPITDLEVRREFDSMTVDSIGPIGIDVVAYAGYMKVATAPLINAFLGVNVHPADLSITARGNRKFVGHHAVRDAILAGEKRIRSTTHIVEGVVDDGRILMISSPLEVNLSRDFNSKDKDQVKSAENYWQSKLKESGDWVIFPKTLEYIAQGRYSQDEKGNLYFEGKPIPSGLSLN